MHDLYRATVLLLLPLAVACDGGAMENSSSDPGTSTGPDAQSTGDADPTTTEAATTDASTTDATTMGHGETTDPAETSSSTGADASSSSGEPAETAGHSSRFEDVVTKSGMQALLDLETNLLWVNDVNACNPLGAPSDDTPMIAMQYCNDLVFQGLEDWRMPSTEEASELITAALDEGVDLVYQNPGCPAVITMGGAAVQTHNGEMPGSVDEMPPSLGIRCVRMQ